MEVGRRGWTVPWLTRIDMIYSKLPCRSPVLFFVFGFHWIFWSLTDRMRNPSVSFSCEWPHFHKRDIFIGGYVWQWVCPLLGLHDPQGLWSVVWQPGPCNISKLLWFWQGYKRIKRPRQGITNRAPEQTGRLCIQTNSSRNMGKIRRNQSKRQTCVGLKSICQECHVRILIQIASLFGIVLTFDISIFFPPVCFIYCKFRKNVLNGLLH